MAACDANYCFTFVDVGQYGRISDGGVFAPTFLARKLENDPNFLPPESNVSNSNRILPYVFVGDEAFPLKRYLMRPFPGRDLVREKRVFNYRLSRARRCIENAFGILAARWRVMLTTMPLLPDNAAWVTLACCCLHNFLMKVEMQNANRVYCPSSFSDRPYAGGAIDEGVARSYNLLDPLEAIPDINTPDQIRNSFTSYFNNEGAVSWQRNV